MGLLRTTATGGDRANCAPALLAIVALVAFAGLGACGQDERRGGDPGGPLQVVASFYPIAEAVSRVGGDHVEVTNLTPPGVEPHDVELTTRQVDQIEDADVVVYLGGAFQEAIAKTAGRRDAGTLDLLARVDVEQGGADALEEGHGGEDEDAHSGGGDAHAEENGHGDEGARGREEGGAGQEGEQVDPHFWLNPVLMADAVDAIADELADVAPERAEEFRTNARAYVEELRRLDAAFERGLADCDRREIVTSHAAFFYLAERYDLTQLAIAGLSPEAEPDADRIASLTDQIEATGITTVFYEENVSPAVAETLADEAGVVTAVLSPLEGLTEEQVEADKDYVAVMNDNLAVLRQALGCR